MEINSKILELINNKRLGKEHSSADIYWLINYLDKIPDYQLSAWLMAVCLQGLTQSETVELTRAMAFSGHVLTLQRHAECEIEHEDEVDLEQTFGKKHVHDENCSHDMKRSDFGASQGIRERGTGVDLLINEDAERANNAGLRQKRKLLNRGFVDKHSTGGVGDKTSLVLGPLLAAIGFKVSKFSGRALGHTGGTVDKLEAIPGFRTNISMKQFETQIETIGIALGAQTDEFAPADKRLYALRDKTGTVESIPLIAASVMSKKIAGGADHIILDVKVGKGAFMKNLRDAEKLARAMKDIGSKLNLNVQVLLTNMDQPLGATVGNAIEVLEAISVLQGYKNFEAYLSSRAHEVGVAIHHSKSGDPFASLRMTAGNDETSDFYNLCIELASTIADRKEVISALESGEAYAKFIEFVRAQSDADAQLEAVSVIASPKGVAIHSGIASASPRNDGVVSARNDLLGQDLDLLIAQANKPRNIVEVAAGQDGYIAAIDAEQVGLAIHQLGYQAQEADGYIIDNSAGLILHKKVGDKVTKGEPLFTLMAAALDKLNSVQLLVEQAMNISKSKAIRAKLVYKKI